MPAISVPLETDDAGLPTGRSRPSLVNPGLGPDAKGVPTEQTLLLRVALPLPSHRQRQAAVAFAVEDMIGEPLDVCHVALGPEITAGEYLVMVVKRSAMVEWTASLRGTRQRLVPDVLGLPVPVEGGLSVLEMNGRVLVRRADGTGYATGNCAFEAFWRAEGAPRIALYGGQLSGSIDADASGIMTAVPTPEAVQVDLLQGVFAQPDSAMRGLVWRLGLVALVALVLHGCLWSAKIMALRDIAQAREVSLRAELAARVQGLPTDAPLELAMRRAMPSDEAGGGGFLKLFARVSDTLEPFKGEIAVRNLVFDGSASSLALLLEAPDLATLQAIEADLAATGLVVSAGVATTGNGAAEVRYVIEGDV